ncbi:unnamed protein product [Closterium sp. NIES-53]
MDGLLHQVQKLKMTEQAQAQASPASPLQSASLQASPLGSGLANQGRAMHDREGAASRFDPSSSPAVSHTQEDSTSAAVASSEGAPVTSNIGATVASNVGSALAPAVASSVAATRRLSLSSSPAPSPASSTVRRSLDLSGMSLNPHAAEFVPVFGPPSTLTTASQSEPAAAGAGAGGGGAGAAGGVAGSAGAAAAGYASFLQGSNAAGYASSLQAGYGDMGSGPAGYNGGAAADETFEECEEELLSRSQSHNSNASDDEYRRFWRDRLPDELLSFDESPKGRRGGRDGMSGGDGRDGRDGFLQRGMGMEMDVGGGGGVGVGGNSLHRHAASMPSLDSGHMSSSAAAGGAGGAAPSGGPDSFDRQGYGYSFRQGVGPPGGPPAAQSMGNILEEVKSDSALDHIAPHRTALGTFLRSFP